MAYTDREYAQAGITNANRDGVTAAQVATMQPAGIQSLVNYQGGALSWQIVKKMIVNQLQTDEKDAELEEKRSQLEASIKATIGYSTFSVEVDETGELKIVDPSKISVL